MRSGQTLIWNLGFVIGPLDVADFQAVHAYTLWITDIPAIGAARTYLAAIRHLGDRIRVVHLKDVRAIDAAPGYQWVELGRGRVDVQGCVAALNATGFSGWAIIELDKVPDQGGSPKASAILNKQ